MRWMRFVAGTVLGWTMLGWTAPPCARADETAVERTEAEPEADVADVLDTPSDDDARRERRLEWAPWIGNVSLLGVALTLEVALRPSDARVRFSGPIDDGFSGMILDSPDARLRAAAVSDALVLGLMLAPLGEILGSHLEGRSRRSRRERGREAYRLLTGASLAYASQALIVAGTKNLVGRARPYDADCAGDPASHPNCNSSRRYRSFISGHTSVAFTSASLLCAIQRLRGRRGAAQRLGCIVGLASATVVASLRVAAQRHYFSDVFAGAVVGFLTGWVMPLFVYPRDLRGSDAPPVPEPRRIGGHDGDLRETLAPL